MKFKTTITFETGSIDLYSNSKSELQHSTRLHARRSKLKNLLYPYVLENMKYDFNGDYWATSVEFSVDGTKSSVSIPDWVIGEVKQIRTRNQIPIVLAAKIVQVARTRVYAEASFKRSQSFLVIATSTGKLRCPVCKARLRRRSEGVYSKCSRGHFIGVSVWSTERALKQHQEYL